MKAVFLFFVAFFLHTLHAQEMPLFVKNVYNNMYASMSNGNVVKPKLILDYNNADEVATFYPKVNEVRIGAKFIAICRTFGKDSSNAMAHVLGHELAHILLQQYDFVKQVGNGYASKEINKQMKKIQKTLQDSVFERQADEYSAFYAHIAGYNTAKLGEKVLDSVYTLYNFPDKALGIYPPLKERKAICSASLKKMSVLKSLFDYANLATMAGNYDFAIASYETIIKEKFPSREIFNNLTTVYILKALSEVDTLEFPYIFPVEIDFKSRLYSTERSIFDEFEDNLLEALRYADLALGNNKNYDKAWLNKGIAEFLLGKKVEAQFSLYNAMTFSDSITKIDINTMNALYEHKYGNWELALNKLSELSETNALAKKNYHALTKGHHANEPVDYTNSFLNSLDKIVLPKVDFNSTLAISSDSLKKSLQYEKNIHLRTIKNGDFTAYQGKFDIGETKPVFTFFEWNNVPKIEFKVDEMNNLPQFKKSENTDYYVYKNWIIEVNDGVVKKCFLVKR